MPGNPGNPVYSRLAQLRQVHYMPCNIQHVAYQDFPQKHAPQCQVCFAFLTNPLNTLEQSE